MIILKAILYQCKLGKIYKETSGFIMSDQGDDDEKNRMKNLGWINTEV